MDELQFYYSKDRIIFNNVDCNANMQSRICIVSNDKLQFSYSEDKIIFNNVGCNANMQCISTENMLKLMGKKIFTILCIIVFNWT